MNYKCKQGFQSRHGYVYKSTVITEQEFKALAIPEQLYFSALYETPSCTFEMPTVPIGEFLNDYRPPEPDYDHYAEQFQVDQDRRAAEDYERKLIENSNR